MLFNLVGNPRFKAVAEQIDSISGEESNRRELQSEWDDFRQRIKYQEAGGVYVRFNITFI